MRIRAAVVPLIAALAVGYTANDLVSPQPSESANTDQQLRYLKFIDRDLYYLHKDLGALKTSSEGIRATSDETYSMLQRDGVLSKANRGATHFLAQICRHVSPSPEAALNCDR